MAWPTTDEPRTEFVTVRFSVAEAAELDWLQGVTNAKDRSAAVRSAVARVSTVERRRQAKTAQRGGDQPVGDVMHGD